MRKFLGIVLPTLLVVLLLVLGFTLVFALVAAIAAFSGWLLRLVFTLSLFESMVLGTLFIITTYYIVTSVVGLFASPDMLGRSTPFADDDEEEEEDADEMEHRRIPDARFFDAPAKRTWETWLRYEFANDIYAEFQDEPDAVHNLNDSQSQELAIRLADLALDMLKRKTTHARRYAITIPAFKREMSNRGLRTYDDDILRLAVAAVNLNMEYYREDIRKIMASDGWQQPTPDYDD